MEDTPGCWFVHSLHVYPIKSCRGIDLPSSPVLPEGLEFDRCWCVVNDQNICVDQRSAASALARVAVSFDSGDRRALIVQCDGMDIEPLVVPTAEADYSQSGAQRVSVSDAVKNKWFGHALVGWDAGASAERFFTAVMRRHAPRLSKPRQGHTSGPRRFRLVRFARSESSRRVSRSFGGKSAIARAASANDTTAFADVCALHAITLPSLELLNHRIVSAGRAAVPADRFRANIVLSATYPRAEARVQAPFDTERSDCESMLHHASAFAEDGWSDLNIGGVRCRKLHGTTRCTIPNADQRTGARAGQKAEPYTTLKAFRPAPFGYGKHGGPEFGMWLAVDTQNGKFTVGGKVTVTQKMCIEPEPEDVLDGTGSSSSSKETVNASKARL